MQTIGVGMSPNIAFVQDFIDDYGLSTPVMLADNEYRIASHYGVRATPVWILMDERGEILRSGTQVDDRLRQAVAGALGN